MAKYRNCCLLSQTGQPIKWQVVFYRNGFRFKVWQICKQEVAENSTSQEYFKGKFATNEWFFDILFSAILCKIVCQTLKRRPSEIFSPYKGADDSNYCLLLDHFVILSTTKPYYYFCSRDNEIIWVSDPSKFIKRITVKEKVGNHRCRFLKGYGTKFW